MNGLFDNDENMEKITKLETISDDARKAINLEVLDCHDLIRRVVIMKMEQFRQEGRTADQIANYLDILTAGLLTGASFVFTQQNKLCHAWMFGKLLTMCTNGGFTLALVSCAALPMKDGSPDPELERRYGKIHTADAKDVSHIALEMEGGFMRVHLNEAAEVAVQRVYEQEGEEAVHAVSGAGVTKPSKTVH